MSYRDRNASGHRLSPRDVQYLQDFSAGQREFVQQQTMLSVERLEVGDATGAIVEGRKITDIPQAYRGATQITTVRNGTVVTSTPREPAHIINDVRQAANTAHLRGEKHLEACQLAADTYPHVPEIVPQTIERARLLLYGREATEWALALADYTDRAEFHGAAVSGLELAIAHAPDTPSKRLNELQLSAYTIASDSARHFLAEVPNQADRFAERESARTHLVNAVAPTIEHYATFAKVSGDERSRILHMLYELEDNTYLSDEFIIQAYGLFTRSTFPGHIARKFFKREVAEAARRIEAKRLYKTRRSHPSPSMVRLPYTNRPQL
jgi:hypothetical protein